MPQPYEERLDRLFGALSDRTRRRMLQQLCAGPSRVTDLAGRFQISLPAVSKHIGVLEKAGLVDREKQGRVHQISLRADTMKQAQTWLEFYRQFWERNFDNLEAYLEQEDADSSASSHQPQPNPPEESA